jgi:putative redox protein
MVDIFMRYDGDMRCTARHGPSSVTLSTDAPADNHGRGSSFSPTDLLATSLGVCMLTIMGILAHKRGWNIDGIEMRVRKEMTKTPPRKVERLSVDFTVPPAVARALDADAKRLLEKAAHTCPVRLSIHDSIDVPVNFGW